MQLLTQLFWNPFHNNTWYNRTDCLWQFVIQFNSHHYFVKNTPILWTNSKC